MNVASGRKKLVIKDRLFHSPSFRSAISVADLRFSHSCFLGSTDVGLCFGFAVEVAGLGCQAALLVAEL